MSTARSRRATILGRILVVFGATLAGACVLFVFSTLWAPSADGHTWKSEAGPICLTSSSRTDEPQCVISPESAERRYVQVPPAPRQRALHVTGTRVYPWFDGTARMSCSPERT